MMRQKPTQCQARSILHTGEDTALPTNPVQPDAILITTSLRLLSQVGVQEPDSWLSKLKTSHNTVALLPHGNAGGPSQRLAGSYMAGAP